MHRHREPQNSGRFKEEKSLIFHVSLQVSGGHLHGAVVWVGVCVRSFYLHLAIKSMGVLFGGMIVHKSTLGSLFLVAVTIKQNWRDN